MKIFDGIDFPELEQPKVPEPVIEIKSKVEQQKEANIDKAFQAFHEQVMRMIRAVESGQSNIRPAMQLKGSAVLSVAARMLELKTKQSLTELLEIIKQDFGNRFYLEILRVLDGEECKTIRNV